MKKSTSNSNHHRTVRRRSSNRDQGLRFKLRVIIDKIFGKRPASSRSARAADNRSRKVIAYAATAFVVFTVLMTVVLAAGGKVVSGPPSSIEPAQTQKAEVSASDAIPTQTPFVTTPPENTVQSTPEPTEEATPSPTEKPTEKPMEKPTEKPTPTPTETPEPTPTKEPEPTPTPEPTPPPFNVEDAVAYYKVEADAYYNEMGYSSNSYEYTEDEKYLLAQIIEIESRGEPIEGMVAVGNVVMNRVFCNEYANSITEVITSGAFSYEKHKDRVPSPEAIRAASAVLDDEYWTIPQNVYYFNSNKPEGENWGSHVYYTKIGGHCFYTENYGGRSTSSDVPPRLFERTYKWAQFGCKKDERVKRIQYMLNKLNFDVSADGIFGKGTSKALKLFQESKGLEADGVAGPSTIKKLIKAFGVDNYYDKYMAD